MKINMILIIQQPSTPETETFENKNWKLSDIEHYGEDVKYIEKKYKFVARNDVGVLVGILDLKVALNVAYIDSVLVDSESRRQGIGKELILKAEKFSKSEGCTKIWLDTDEDWNAAKFYKKMGYEITGTHENHFMGKRAVIFTKYL